MAYYLFQKKPLIGFHKKKSKLACLMKFFFSTIFLLPFLLFPAKAQMEPPSVKCELKKEVSKCIEHCECKWCQSNETTPFCDDTGSHSEFNCEWITKSAKSCDNTIAIIMAMGLAILLIMYYVCRGTTFSCHKCQRRGYIEV